MATTTTVAWRNGACPTSYFTSAAGSDSFVTDNAINLSSSIWRAKIGISYEF